MGTISNRTNNTGIKERIQNSAIGKSSVEEEYGCRNSHPQASRSGRNRSRISPMIVGNPKWPTVGMDRERGGYRIPDLNHRHQRYRREETAKSEPRKSKEEGGRHGRSNSRRRWMSNLVVGVGDLPLHTYGKAYRNVRSGGGRINYIEHMRKLKDEGGLMPHFRVSLDYCLCRDQEEIQTDGNMRSGKEGAPFLRLYRYRVFGFLRSQFQTQWGTMCSQDSIGGRICFWFLVYLAMGFLIF